MPQKTEIYRPEVYLNAVQIFTLLCVPFYFGGERLLAWGISGTLYSINLICILLFLPTPHIKPSHRNAQGLAIILIALGLLWAVIQIIPLPINLLANPIWSIANITLESENYDIIAVSPDEAYLTLLKILIAIVAAYNAYRIAVTYRNDFQILIAMSLIGTCYSIHGMYWLYKYPTHHFWLERAPYYTILSTFVNRNTFAMYIGICSHANLAILIKLIKLPDIYHSRRLKLSSFFQNKLLIILIFLATYVIQMITILLTGSRAGVATIFVAQIITLSLLLLRKSTRSLFMLLTLTFIIPLITYIYYSYSSVVDERAASLDMSIDERVELYKEVWSAISDRYLTGYGLGAFENVFRFHKSLSFDPAGIWLRAHNAYLELMLALGIPAALTVFFAIGLIVSPFVRSLINHRPYTIQIAATCIAISVALHSLFDFGIQAGGTALTLCTLIGTTIGRTNTQNIQSKLI